MSTKTFPRCAGVLLHPTSLPGAHGVGDLGAGATAFVDWLADAGLSRWQILPVVPPGPGGSPYSSPSAFAGNPWLIDLHGLVAEGLLSRRDLDPRPGDKNSFNPDRYDFDTVARFKGPRLQAAARTLRQAAAGRARIDAFVVANPWVIEYALFAALKDSHGGKPWWQWEPSLANRDPAALDEARTALAEAIADIVGIQVLFDGQWNKLKAHCAKKRVKLIGDIPIYVDHDSADVWSHRDQFLLDDQGQPTVVAGCPPDVFTVTGQWWGNPIYDWKKMAASGHAFWVERLRRVLALTDIVRIDHFRGFAAYWSIPSESEDARGGSWQEGPGYAVFRDLAAALGELPVILEDLGVVDEPVVTLRNQAGLPGMRVLQFAFGDDEGNPFLPHNFSQNTVVYTGTHDNDTTLGWWHTTPEAEKQKVRETLGIAGHDLVWDMIRAAFASVAHTAIIPMQDVLALDSGARMNLPGTDEGNWSWRVRVEAFHPNLSSRLGYLSRLYNRDELVRSKRIKRPDRE